MQSLEEFHTQVSRVFLEPHVLGLCLCLLLWGFMWILLPSGTLGLLSVPALILSSLTILSQELCTTTGGKGQLKGCVKTVGK